MNAVIAQPVQQISIPPLTAYALSPQDLVNQITLIQQAMKMVMKDGVHYGTIPGTEKKDRDGNLAENQPKALYQAGAETLSVMFGLTTKVDLASKDLPGGHREVTAQVSLFDRSGNMRAQATGLATTMESKHRYRGAAGKTCPACGEKQIKRSAAEYGGGYYCDAKRGGCSAKYKPTSPEAQALDKQPSLRAENQDPADVYNTVIKMAEKRAFVAAVRRATGCSDIFGHDLEDLEGQLAEIKEAEGVVISDAGHVGKTEAKADPAKADVRRETVKEPAQKTPRVAMNGEGRALKEAVDAIAKDQGTPILQRLTKIYGAESFPAVPDAKIESVRKDMAELTAAIKDGIPALADKLAQWENAAKEGQ